MSVVAGGNKVSLDEKLFTVRRKPVSQSHITLDQQLCADCGKRVCTYICPAGVYTWNEADAKIEVSHEDCLECGACRVACGMNNIDWSNPVWGEGISYRTS